MATLRLLLPTNPSTTISSPSSITNFSISGSGTVSSPYSGASTNQGLHNTTANATFSIGGTGTATIEYNVTISSEQNFDFGRILKNGVQELNVSGPTTTHIGSFTVSGLDTVQIQYVKDGSANANNDVFTINSLYIADPPTVKFLGATTLKFIDASTVTNAPSIQYISRFGFGDEFSYSYRVTNLDPSTADVDSDVNFSPPSLVYRVTLGSNVQSSTITSDPMIGPSATIYARAIASGKSFSTISSLVVP
jgi:hypothetical protein